MRRVAQGVVLQVNGVPVWGVFIDGFIWVCHQGRVHWNVNLDLISVSRVCLGCEAVCLQPG